MSTFDVVVSQSITEVNDEHFSYSVYYENNYWCNENGFSSTSDCALYDDNLLELRNPSIFYGATQGEIFLYFEKKEDFDFDDLSHIDIFINLPEGFRFDADIVPDYENTYLKSSSSTIGDAHPMHPRSFDRKTGHLVLEPPGSVYSGDDGIYTIHLYGFKEDIFRNLLEISTDPDDWVLNVDVSIQYTLKNGEVYDHNNVPKVNESFQVVADDYTLDCTIDGIHYRLQLIGNRSATVIGLPQGEKYSGNITVPANVDFGGRIFDVTKIGEYAFSNCPNLSEVVLPEGLLGLENYSFKSGTPISCVSLPNSLKYINEDVFRNSPVKSLLLGRSLERIGRFSIFPNYSPNPPRTEVIVLAPIPPDASFLGYSGSVPIYVPDDSFEAYRIDSDWRLTNLKKLSNYIIPESLSNDAYVGELFEYTFTTNAESCVNISIPDLPEWLKYYEDEDGQHRLAGTAPNAPESYSFDILACMQGTCFSSHTVEFEVLAATGCTGNQLIDNIHYQLNDDNTATVIALPNDEMYSGHVVIPPTVVCGGQEYRVTEVGAYSFDGCTDLLSVSFPETLFAIGTNAFRICTNLTTLTLPESLEIIGDEAFVHCVRLGGSLSIPDKVTTIGSRAFFNCHGFTGSLTIGDEVITIGDSAFGGCTGFKGSLVIGNSVTAIGSQAFSGCGGFSNSLTIPNSVVTIGDYAFNVCANFSGSLLIGNSVSTIGDGAFSNCRGLTGALNIPASVTSIGTAAFRGCIGLTCVAIPSSVGSLGENSFTSMSSLNELIFLSSTPSSITGTGTLTEESKPIYVPDASMGAYQTAWGRNYNLQPFSNIINDLSVEQFGIGDAFNYEFGSVVNGCMQYNVSGLPSWLPADEASGIIEGTLEEPGEYEITISATQGGHQLVSKTMQFEVIDNTGCTGNQLIDNIHYQLNDDNTATVIALPNDEMYSGHVVIPPTVDCGGQEYRVTTIGSQSFGDYFQFNSSLLSVDLPNTITKIEQYAFIKCRELIAITLPESLIHISEMAFYQCYELTEITIPSNVEIIERGAFDDCSNLEYVTFDGNKIKDLDKWTFGQTSVSCFVLPNSVETMDGGALRWSPIQTVILGESLQDIYYYGLFDDYNNILTEIILLAPTPPSVSGFGFAEDVPIYVPDASYEAYSMDDAWGLREIRMLSAYFTPKALPVDPYVGEWFEYTFTTNAESCVNISIPGKPGWLSYEVHPSVNEDGELEHTLSGTAPDTPGPYSFEVLASLQGTQFASHTVAFDVVPNPCVGEAPVVTIVRENEGTLICPGESIRLEAYEESGNLEHYIYEWYDSSNTLLKEGSENYLVVDNVNNSKLGAYRVQLIDSDTNCSGVNSYTLSSSLFYNIPNVYIDDLGPTTCRNSADGEATITIAGPDATYDYTLSLSGQEVESVTNAAPNEEIGFNTLGVGTYLLSGTTANGCAFRRNFTIQNGGPRFTDVCTQLLPIDLIPGEQVSSEVSFTVNRGRYISSQYDYNIIINSSGEKVFTQDKSESYGTNAAASFTYIHGENYTLLIYENGAECDESSKLLKFKNLSPRLTAPTEVHRCFEGQNVTISGHVSLNFNNCTDANLSPTIELLREVNGEFIEPVEVSYQFDNKNNISISSNSENHPAGRYLLRFAIDDTYYGSMQQEKIIEVIENEMIDVTVEAFTVTCPGGNDGRLEARVSGGVPPYRYYWYDDGGELASTSSVATMLLPGDYTLKLTDSRDCDMEEAFGPYTVNDKEPWGDISVTLPDSYSDNCFVEAEITGVEEGMTYTFEWIRRSPLKLVQFADNLLFQEENYTLLSKRVWTDKVKVPAGSNSAVSISDDYYVEPGHEYYLIIRDENGCKVNSLDQDTPLFFDHTPGTPFMLEPIEVEREYNLVFAWKTRVQEAEEELPPAIGQTTGPSIAASSMAQDMKEQALKCAAIAGKAAEATFEEICLSTEMLSDQMTLEYENGSYHYTLYYFDRAGNLIKTVPPEGVNLYTEGDSWAGHSMATEYRYNSLGQLIWQNTPDGGQTRFLYNNAGQLRFSQNAQQAIDNTFSYTKYDELGRVRETGQGDFDHTDIPYGSWIALINDADNIFEADMVASLDERFPQATIDEAALGQKTVTWYGQKSDIFNQGHQQRYLLNRVSHTAHTNSNGETITTYFSYDPHGNVEWMVQDLPLLGKSIIEYEYDLISGNVTQVAFNKGRPDQFFHRYFYDADNRITDAETSVDGVVWESDARYSYYKHGPLKRMELGEDNVQGLDYVYTIQGWLKAINHPSLSPFVDIGGDGTNSTAGNDAFGMILSYYEGDFKNEHSTFDPESPTYSAINPSEKRDLYNGNIAAWTHSTAQSHPSGGLYKGDVMGQQFVYDKLNRIKESRFNTLITGIWLAEDNFSSSYEYDANGNITHLHRTANQGIASMDDLVYHYQDGNNKLDHVRDVVQDGLFQDDIDDQQPGNYEYDAIGNLITDEAENIDSIEWTVQGKVASISKSDNTNIAFTYDAQGNRTSKTVTLPGGLVTTTYYVRDAQGNVMSVYKGMQESATGGATGHDHVITLSEQPIYGSSRIGMRLGNGLEVKRINFPLTGDPEVIRDGDYTLLGNLMSATISNQGAFVTGAKALPGISASLKALTADTWSLSLFTDNANTYGNLEYQLLQGDTNPVWEGEAAPTGTWSHTLTAGAETSDYQLSIRQKSSIFDQPIARHIHGKQYELTDHLGNVRAVVSAGLEYNPVGKHINPRVIATNTYYPFGMLISSLSGNSEGYRYGFNGKEKDDQGEWGMTAYDYGFRIYNPGLGRFLSVDPLTKDYPSWSPYPFAMNRVIDGIDLDGLEFVQRSCLRFEYEPKLDIPIKVSFNMKNLHEEYTSLSLSILFSGQEMNSISPKAIETKTLKDWDIKYPAKGYKVENGTRIPTSNTKFISYKSNRSAPAPKMSWEMDKGLGGGMGAFALIIGEAQKNMKYNAIQEAKLLDAREWSDVENTVQLLFNAMEIGLIDEVFLMSKEGVSLFNSVLSHEEKRYNLENDKVFYYTQFLFKNRDAIMRKDKDAIEGSHPSTRIKDL